MMRTIISILTLLILTSCTVLTKKEYSSDLKQTYNRILERENASVSQVYLKKMNMTLEQYINNNNEIKVKYYKDLYYDGVACYLDGNSCYAIKIWQALLDLPREDMQKYSHYYYPRHRGVMHNNVVRESIEKAQTEIDTIKAKLQQQISNMK